MHTQYYMLEQASIAKFVFKVKTCSDLKFFKKILKRQDECPQDIIIFNLTKPTNHISPRYKFCICVSNRYYYDTFHDRLMIDLHQKSKPELIELCNIDFEDSRRFTKFEEYVIS